MGTFAALCIGVALSAMAETTRDSGLVGRYKSLLSNCICTDSFSILQGKNGQSLGICNASEQSSTELCGTL
jgi:hypothetical protein